MKISLVIFQKSCKISKASCTDRTAHVSLGRWHVQGAHWQRGVWETWCNEPSVVLPFPHSAWRMRSWGTSPFSHPPLYPKLSLSISVTQGWFPGAPLLSYSKLPSPESCFQRVLCREKVIWLSLAVSPTSQLTCAFLLSARLWGYGGKGDPAISLKELNPDGVQICSLNEFGRMIYPCPSNFQILR